MALPIGGFMPIPLAMMIPFMATQSMVMGDAFGRAFQYGKRKISAMSNEEFNATSLEQQASEMFKAYKIIIGENHLQNAILESTKLQKIIIQEMLLILPKFISDVGTDTFGGTDIKTPIDDHTHSINRPHTHSGNVTIIGTTTTNGITTTHYSDGSTTTSGTKNLSPGEKKIFVEPYDINCHRNGVSAAERSSETLVMDAHYNLFIVILKNQVRDIPFRTRIKDQLQAKHKAAYGHFVNTKCAEQRARTFLGL